MSPVGRVLVVAALVGALVGIDVGRPAPVLAQTVHYVLPVEAPLLEGFGLPAGPYGPGNRGWRMGTTAGQPVRAAADGTVRFAGAVAGALHVTIQHADGLRTTVSYLRTVVVIEGDALHQGDLIGTASDHVHIGVRDAGGTYLDPATVFGPPRPLGARLVPDGEVSERASVDAGPAGAAPQPAPVPVPGPGPDPVPGSGPVPGPDPGLDPGLDPEGGPALPAGWPASGAGCTPDGVAVPAPAGRRIVVLVGGLGSTSEAAAIDRFDGATAGYDAGDVVRFSYAGGRVPDPTERADLAGIPSSPYGPADTHRRAVESAERLNRLLLAVHAAAPAARIDVVAHSLGGVVARLAVERLPPGTVDALVMVGSPLRGAPLADLVTAAGRAGDVATTAAVEALLDSVGSSLDPGAPVLTDLRTDSAVVRHLAAATSPPGVRTATVGATGDLVVPGTRTSLPGVPATVVGLHGPTAHDRLPASKEVARTVGLVAAGLPPPCVGVGASVGAALIGEGIERAERALFERTGLAPPRPRFRVSADGP